MGGNYKILGGYNSVKWLIEDYSYLWVIENDERITGLENRIFLSKSVNEFYLSVQVLITSSNNQRS